MKITYYRKHDLLFICLDENAKEVVNEDAADGVVLEIGEGDRIVGIEILDASKRLDLSKLLAVEYAEVA
jgi:uncharacterized protein YuzE